MFSPVVAVLAGIVGMVSLTEARANALIGVSISVTTIPVTASVGVSIAFSSWSEAWGSALQLLRNVVVLIVVGAVGLSTQRRIWRWRMGRPPGALRPEGRRGHEHVLAGFDDTHLPGTLAIRPACAAAPISAQVRRRAVGLWALLVHPLARAGGHPSGSAVGASYGLPASSGPRPEARRTLRTLLRWGLSQA